MIRVMIVDDAAFMRNMLKNYIIEAGFEVVCEATNGVEAIRLFAQHHPDIVTMDITMPDMDGVAAVTEIIKLHPTAKIIMCSAMGQQKMVLDAIVAGAKDFIVKPFQKERVLESINKVLDKKD
jgi:two-component system chemotaxis response regulator CheY